MEEIIYNCQAKEEFATTVQNQLERDKPYAHQLTEVGFLLENCKIGNFQSKVNIGLLVHETNEILNSLEIVAKQIDCNQLQFATTDRNIGERLNV